MSFLVKSGKLSLFKLLLFIFYSQSTAFGTDRDIFDRHDPPFFRLVDDNEREIYILGSPHTVPLETLLSNSTIAELNKISDQKAILYTEHEMTNRVGFEHLKNPENIFSDEMLQQHGDLRAIKKLLLRG